LQSSNDDTYEFRQDANFWYLTGIDFPDIVLVMDNTGDYLIAPKQDPIKESFDGVISSHKLAKTSGITAIFDDFAGWDRLKNTIRINKQAATLFASPAYIKFFGFYTNPARARLINRIKRISKVELTDIRKSLATLRMVKQPSELLAIKKAIEITTDSLGEVIGSLQSNRYKYAFEAEADLTYKFKIRRASGHAFSPIIASGSQACTIHNLANDAKLTTNQMVIFDVGAVFDHYPADISRTKIQSRPSPRQKAIYEAVIEVQRYALSLLKPGITIRWYEGQVETYMGQQLKKLGIINAVNSKAVRQYFPHATSHYLGLNVHDAGDYDADLLPGMVLAVEPGIYVPKEGIGVRVEDDVIITNDGVEVLSSNLSQELR
jgi:Xaa-Pro aminopeptidase